LRLVGEAGTIAKHISRLPDAVLPCVSSALQPTSRRRQIAR
jgi:hypothetical protein